MEAVQRKVEAAKEHTEEGSPVTPGCDFPGDHRGVQKAFRLLQIVTLAKA